MTHKISGLFSIGEDLDDEDLLEPDWGVQPAPAAATGTTTVSPGALRGSSVSRRDPEDSCPQQAGWSSASPCSGSSLHSSAPALRRLPSTRPAPQTNSPPTVASLQSRGAEVLKPPGAQEDFDDWDVDLADLDEGQICRPLQSPAPPAPVAKTLRPPPHAREPSPAPPASTSSGNKLRPQTPSAPLQSPYPRPVVRSVPLRSPNPCASPSPVSRPQGPRTTPRPSPQPRAPAPSTSSTILSPHPLHTPVFTNRLVQLVSASSKPPSKRSRSGCHQPRTRRFPGPAGLLPEQPQGQNLDEVVVSVPLTPAHGAVARLQSQVSSSQAEDDDFGGGAWAAMKAEIGLDERNPSCFLHSYSVVMVLRKAALKRLAKNKVPNMAVLLKSIVHTHADARAVFKDPTGEIQGTVHRRLLEERVEELKVGAVLLLKQVGVFSPSHRNHYLNVTPNNLLRIYSPEGVALTSTQLPPLVLVRVTTSRNRNPPLLDACLCPRADDDLDELLGELPEDTYSF
uniref:Homologous recombination factor with OB-fold n=1 Tax=Takifugu rubripes TaxID=31033 RepID=A0A3B5KJ46_TAKRU